MNLASSPRRNACGWNFCRRRASWSGSSRAAAPPLPAVQPVCIGSAALGRSRSLGAFRATAEWPQSRVVKESPCRRPIASLKSRGSSAVENRRAAPSARVEKLVKKLFVNRAGPACCGLWRGADHTHSGPPLLARRSRPSFPHLRVTAPAVRASSPGRRRSRSRNVFVLTPSSTPRSPIGRPKLGSEFDARARRVRSLSERSINLEPPLPPGVSEPSSGPLPNNHQPRLAGQVTSRE
jgi:hypothetical protein